MFPLTVSQLLDLFEVYEPINLESKYLKGIERKIKGLPPLQDERHLMLRSYELLDFIKKYLRPIETAINSMGIKFIQKYCIEKMKGQKRPNIDLKT